MKNYTLKAFLVLLFLSILPLVNAMENTAKLSDKTHRRVVSAGLVGPLSLYTQKPNAQTNVDDNPTLARVQLLLAQGKKRESYVSPFLREMVSEQPHNKVTNDAKAIEYLIERSLNTTHSNSTQSNLGNIQNLAQETPPMPKNPEMPKSKKFHTKQSENKEFNNKSYNDSAKTFGASDFTQLLDLKKEVRNRSKNNPPNCVLI